MGDFTRGSRGSWTDDAAAWLQEQIKAHPEMTKPELGLVFDGFGPSAIRPRSASTHRRLSQTLVYGPMTTQADSEDDESFFSSLASMTHEEAIAACDAEIIWAKAEASRMAGELAKLPRGEKQKGREMALEMTRLHKHANHVKVRRASHAEIVARREKHTLWCEAVTAVCGADKLADVFSYMKNKRRT